MLREVNSAQISADEAVQRLARSPYWGWTALAPQRPLRLVLAVGPRTVAMAQRMGHQVVQRLAPAWVPLFVPAGLQAYGTAVLPPWGPGRPPARRRDQGPRPQPRWMPGPHWLYAQGVQSSRRRRSVGGKYRVGGGTMARVHQVLSACGRKLNTAFVERLTLDMRQRVAAVGRRTNTLCQGETGVRQQLGVDHAYDNFCLPHASLRQPLVVPEPPRGRGAVKGWRPWTPARAAGLPDPVGSLKEVWLYRVPPWPQPQTI